MSTSLMLVATLGLLACAPSRIRRGDDALAARDWKLAVAEYDECAREAMMDEKSSDTPHAEVRACLAQRDKAARVGFAETLDEARRLSGAGDAKGARTLVRALLAAPWTARGPDDAAAVSQARTLLDETLVQFLRSHLEEGRSALREGYPQVAAMAARSISQYLAQLEGASPAVTAVGDEAQALHTTAAQVYSDRAIAKARDEADRDPAGAAKALSDAAQADWYPDALRPRLIAQLAAAQGALAERLLARFEAGPADDFRALHSVIVVLSQAPLEVRAPLLGRFRAARARAAAAHTTLAAQDEKLPVARAAHLAMAAAYGAGRPPDEVQGFLTREGVMVNLHPAEVLDPRCKDFGGTWLTEPLKKWTQAKAAILIDVEVKMKACPTVENKASTEGRYEVRTVEGTYPCRHFDTQHLVYIDGTCTQTRQETVTKAYPSTTRTFESRLEAELSFRWPGGEERMEFNVASSDPIESRSRAESPAAPSGSRTTPRS